MLKNGFLTFCCAFIPGAGQMYQGYMKRGLSLIHTTTSRSSTGLSSELTIPMRQAVRMRERPRFM